MDILLAVANGATLGVLIGVLLHAHRRRLYEASSEKAKEQARKRGAILTKAATYFTFMALCVGLIWTAYFLVLGLMDPAQTEYATNVSQLIVSVLTVISIIFAFYQFLREK